MILIDSNTWVFYFDETLPEHSRVAPRLERLLEGEEILMTSVIQIEVAHYVVRRLGERASPVLATLLALPATLEGLSGEDAKSAIGILESERSTGIGGRDATLLHAARKHEVSLIVSADKPLLKAARKLGIRARNIAT